MRLSLSEVQSQRIYNYLKLIIKWNAAINLVGTNLVGASGVAAMISFHLVDCLALITHLPSGPISLVDVGSGAGLPAVPIAIARPDITVTALEPIHKKHAFLATVRRDLALSNLTTIAERLETHQASHPAAYDVAVSRATFALDTWLTLGKTLVKSSGLVLGMEGAEENFLPAGAERHPYQLMDLATDARTRKRAIIRLHCHGKPSAR